MYDLSFYLENNRCSSSGLMVSKGILNDVCFKNVHNAFSPCFVAPQKNVVESVQKKNLHFVTYCQKANGDVLKYFSIRTLVFGKPICTVSL